MVAGRVYNLRDARQNGTLRLLLKQVGNCFNEIAVIDVLHTAERHMNTPSPANRCGAASRATFRVVTKIEDWLEENPEAEGVIDYWMRHRHEFDDPEENRNFWERWGPLFEYARRQEESQRQKQ